VLKILIWRKGEPLVADPRCILSLPYVDKIVFGFGFLLVKDRSEPVVVQTSLLPRLNHPRWFGLWSDVTVIPSTKLVQFF